MATTQDEATVTAAVCTICRAQLSTFSSACRCVIHASVDARYWREHDLARDWGRRAVAVAAEGPGAESLARAYAVRAASHARRMFAVAADLTALEAGR